ncbi:hypothetical protein ABIF90_004896 [Bradyrhizobium japonicum]
MACASVLPRAPLFLDRHKAISIGDFGAALAMADLTAERERLAEGEPTLPGESAFDNGSPEDEDVSATVWPDSRCIFRHRQRRFRRSRTPWLNPEDLFGLELGMILSVISLRGSRGPGRRAHQQ